MARKMRFPLVCALSLLSVVSCFHAPARQNTRNVPSLARFSAPVSAEVVSTKLDDDLETDEIEFSAMESSLLTTDGTYNEKGIVDDMVDDGKNTMMYTIVALIFVVTSLSALDRVAMSVAMVPLSEELGYTDTVKGSISSLFSVGYGLGILPCGLLLAYASPRIAMATGVTFWSLATIATPFAAEQSSMGLLLFARAIVGGAESVVLPSVQRLLSSWIPADKKSLAVASVFAGFQSGTILAYILSPVVIDMFTWRGLFYVYGGFGLLYLIPWLALAKDEPIPMTVLSKALPETSTKNYDSHNSTISPWDSAKELLASAPWKEFAKSNGVWAMLLAHAANNWGLYNNLSWSPTFYAEQYGMDVRDSAILLVVPSLAGMIGGLSAGTLADAVIRNLKPATDDTVTNVRKAFQGVALFVPAICLAALSWHVPEEPWVAQSLLTGTVGFQAFNSAGYGAANQEKAGAKWTGLLYGITSLPAVMVGTFGVYLTGQILDFTTQDWSWVFGLNAFVNVLGATAFVTLYDSKKEFD